MYCLKRTIAISLLAASVSLSTPCLSQSIGASYLIDNSSPAWFLNQAKPETIVVNGCPVLTLSPTRWSIFICKDVSIRIQNVAASRALKRCWSPALTSALVTMMSSIRGIRWERRICCKCCIWGCMFAS